MNKHITFFAINNFPYDYTYDDHKYSIISLDKIAYDAAFFDNRIAIQKGHPSHFYSLFDANRLIKIDFKDAESLSLDSTFSVLKSFGDLIIESFIFHQTFFTKDETTFFSFNENSFFKTLSFKISSNSVLIVITFLKKASIFYYEQLIDSSALDNYKNDRRFEVVYQLLSITYSKRICISVELAEGHGINSLNHLYSSAGWYERETWDIFGIFFYNHPDLRRILTDYGFKGHPLRKDFPLSGFVEVRYNAIVKSVIYEKASLSQSFREVKAPTSFS